MGKPRRDVCTGVRVGDTPGQVVVVVVVGYIRAPGMY